MTLKTKIIHKLPINDYFFTQKTAVDVKIKNIKVKKVNIGKVMLF